MTVDAALETAANNAERVLKQAGYYK
jgi:hypothetical protein